MLLFIVKLLAWYLTSSVAILTDALESIVNIVAGLIGVYSLYISSKPKDQDHPYGHGKAEFISAAFEGILITFAGSIIIYQAIRNLVFPHSINQLDKGIVLVAVTAVVNYIAGSVCLRIGIKHQSPALVSSGKHLITDTFTTAGIILGLLLIYVTKIWWIDSAVAILFSLLLIYTGYKIVRSSIAGIMDEADENLISKLVETLNENRRENWIDLHNLRIIKYGSKLHIDCHLTVPWYMNVHESHSEIDSLTGLVKNHFGDSIEFFVHSDGCLDFSCAVCTKKDCAVRKFPFEKKIEWTVKNISLNSKHQLHEIR